MIKTSQVKSKKGILWAQLFWQKSTFTVVLFTALYSKSVVILMFIGLESLLTK